MEVVRSEVKPRQTQSFGAAFIFLEVWHMNVKLSAEQL